MLGLKLGTLGHISMLRRTSIGGYDIKGALKIEDIKQMPKEEIIKWVKIL
jgi:tRNA U55 pseudouridine synthase TruB